ncbi:alanyl-tRNA editing protein Aarsd1 [Cimex lectularius]|uniref:Alanyl-transfer RNA synthetases family profile domain-containing protein n=1 Tax=Cimex lectularius TaxID=79782 RepID=A0A8I6SN40_CIMLE|nr:alanyl-tRNA editing protein Aarsd1 [Cimex lectularius]
MVFACQRDSFQKEYTSSVVSCTPAEFKKLSNGKKEKIKCYEVVLKDTILFPEGGGQPCDYGTIDGIPVVHVLRRGQDAVHIVEFPLQEGQDVKQVVDWERRLDHMQQHSGQHLITALADIMFGYATTSWSLGAETSFIELDTPEMTEEQIKQLEDAVNEKIRNGVPVTVSILDENDIELNQTRTRGLPKDHKGSVRIITIKDIEANMCCGTHVSNLSQLQAIKLLGAEKGKKGKTNLQFLVGCRVLKSHGKMYKKELDFNLLLKCNPDSHKEMINKLLATNKTLAKRVQNLLKEVASFEIRLFKAKDPRPKYFIHHKPGGDMDYMYFVVREMDDADTLHLLTIGEKEGGHVLIVGPEDTVEKAAKIVSEILEAKGNRNGTRYQAKVKRLDRLGKLTEKISQIIN